MSLVNWVISGNCVGSKLASDSILMDVKTLVDVYNQIVGGICVIFNNNIQTLFG